MLKCVAAEYRHCYDTNTNTVQATMLKCVSADKLHTSTDTGDISQVQYISYTCMQYIMLKSTNTVQTSQLKCVQKPDEFSKSTFEPDKHILACYAKHTGLQH